MFHDGPKQPFFATYRLFNHAVSPIVALLRVEDWPGKSCMVTWFITFSEAHRTCEVVLGSFLLLLALGKWWWDWVRRKNLIPWRA